MANVSCPPKQRRGPHCVVLVLAPNNVLPGPLGNSSSPFSPSRDARSSGLCPLRATCHLRPFSLWLALGGLAGASNGLYSGPHHGQQAHGVPEVLSPSGTRLPPPPRPRSGHPRATAWGSRACTCLFRNRSLPRTHSSLLSRTPSRAWGSLRQQASGTSSPSRARSRNTEANLKSSGPLTPQQPN